MELRAWLRGRLGIPSAVADVDRVVAHPTRDRLFNAACSLALLAGEHPSKDLEDRVILLLRRAVELGYPPDRLRADDDLAGLRDLPAFRALAGP